MRTYPSLIQGPRRVLTLLAGSVLLALCALPAAAQQRRYLVELGAAGIYQSFDDVTQLGGGTGGMARLGLWLPANFSLEAEGSTLSSKADVGGTDVGVKTFTLSALYNILVGGASSLYLKAGGGGTTYGSDCPGEDEPVPPYPCGGSGALVLGAGARVAVSPTVMVRGEGQFTRNTTSSDRSISNFGVNLGLGLMLGSKPIPDSDGDGVLDTRDRCPGTLAGAQVDGRGCPSDTDNDGVPNGLDRCAATPPGAAVDATGCTRDSDADNIPDGIDRCPDTPSGVLVDPRGCPRDSDGDSIPDGLDRCSETPAGATVDALGCPGDEDGDGVLDGLDRCPRTPVGARVDPTGCAAGQNPSRPAPAGPPPAAVPAPTEPQAARPEPARPEPAQPTPAQPTPETRPAARDTAPPRPAGFGPGVLQGVSFAPGTARLSVGSYVALDSIVKLLLANPKLRVEIAAHTDNVGTAAENLHLTNLQAEAVRNYLVTKGVPFDQVVPRGYGATVPLTSDNTPRGRQANRRIEIREAGP